MRDDLHKTAKCAPVWQELFRLGLNGADRANPKRMEDATAKALKRELNVELSAAMKSLLRKLEAQPSLLEIGELIAGFEPSTPFEAAFRTELRTATGPEGYADALDRALVQQHAAYMREFACRMVEGRVFERVDVERAIAVALNDATVRDACDAFLSRTKLEPKAEPLNLDEVLAPADKTKQEQGR